MTAVREQFGAPDLREQEAIGETVCHLYLGLRLRPQFVVGNVRDNGDVRPRPP